MDGLELLGPVQVPVCIRSCNLCELHAAVDSSRCAVKRALELIPVSWCRTICIYIYIACINPDCLNPLTCSINTTITIAPSQNIYGDMADPRKLSKPALNSLLVLEDSSLLQGKPWKPSKMASLLVIFMSGTLQFQTHTIPWPYGIIGRPFRISRFEMPCCCSATGNRCRTRNHPVSAWSVFNSIPVPAEIPVGC